MLIPFVFELLQGPLLVIPQAIAKHSLTPSLIQALTLVRVFAIVATFYLREDIHNRRRIQ